MEKSTVGIVMMVKDCKDEYLIQAVGSLLSQTYQNWYLYVADSSVKPSKVLQWFKTLVPNKVTLIRSYPPKGPAHGFNVALGKALKENKCGYIARLDSDDFFISNALELLVGFMEGIDDDIDMIYGDVINYEKLSGVWKSTIELCLGEFELMTAGNFIREDNQISGGAILVKDRLYRKIGGWDLSMVDAWDMEWYIHAMVVGAKFKHLQEFIYYHRLRNDSVYAESLKGGKNSRYVKWKKQLLDRKTKYRKEAIKYMFSGE